MDDALFIIHDVVHDAWCTFHFRVVIVLQAVDALRTPAHLRATWGKTMAQDKAGLAAASFTTPEEPEDLTEPAGNRGPAGVGESEPPAPQEQVTPTGVAAPLSQQRGRRSPGIARWAESRSSGRLSTDGSSDVREHVHDPADSLLLQPGARVAHALSRMHNVEGAVCRMNNASSMLLAYSPLFWVHYSSGIMIPWIMRIILDALFRSE